MLFDCRRVEYWDRYGGISQNRAQAIEFGTHVTWRSYIDPNVPTASWPDAYRDDIAPGR